MSLYVCIDPLLNSFVHTDLILEFVVHSDVLRSVQDRHCHINNSAI